MNALLNILISLFCGLFGICAQDNCREMTHMDNTHIVCSYAVTDVSLKLYLNDPSGTPYAGFSKREPSLGSKPHMLMNGGMYHEDLSAVGLYVEGGDQQQRRPKTKKPGVGQ